MIASFFVLLFDGDELYKVQPLGRRTYLFLFGRNGGSVEIPRVQPDSVNGTATVGFFGGWP